MALKITTWRPDTCAYEIEYDVNHMGHYTRGALMDQLITLRRKLNRCKELDRYEVQKIEK